MRSRKTIATPPGATIREQLEDREMTQREFAVRMDLSEKHVSKLINGEVHLTPEVALRLEYVLGVPAQFWLRLEANYQEKCVRVQEENEMDADIEMVKHFPYSEMVSLGWIEATRIAVEKVKNLRSFFQVTKLETLENLMIPGIAYRRTGANTKSDYTLAAWAQKARNEARGLNVESINVAQLQESIPEIRAMTLENPETFSSKLVDLMARCGIALIFLPHIKGSFLHGATFFDGKKIVMGLTVRGHDADKFWFSLFHEIVHVIMGHIGKLEGSDERDEKETDYLAAEILIPGTVLQPFIAEKDISEKTIRDFAKKIGIDPGIVVGRLQKEGVLTFGQFNGLKKQYVIN